MVAAGPGRHERRRSLRAVLTVWIASQLSLVFSGPLAVRALGVEQRGELAMLITVLLTTSLVALFGLPVALTYFTSRDDLPGRQVVSLVRRPLVVRSVIGGLAALVACLLVSLVGPDLAHPWGEGVLTAIGTVLVIFALTSFSVLQGERRPLTQSVLQALPAAAYAIGLAALLLLGIGRVPTVLGVYIAGWGLAGWVAWLVLRKPRADAGPSEVSWPAIRSFGRKAAVAAAAPVDQFRLDQLLVGLLLGHGALGLYVVAAAFQTFVQLPVLLIGTFAGPRIAAAREHVIEVTRGWMLAGWAAGLSTVLVGEAVVGLVLVPAFGSDTAAALTPARLLLVSGLLLVERRLLLVVLQSLNAPRLSTQIEVVSLVLLVVAVSLGALTGGLVGACVGTVVAGAGAVVMLSAVLPRTVRASRATARV